MAQAPLSNGVLLRCREVGASEMLVIWEGSVGLDTGRTGPNLHPLACKVLPQHPRSSLEAKAPSCHGKGCSPAWVPCGRVSETVELVSCPLPHERWVLLG